MATDDLLQQLDTLIQKRLEENNKQIRKEIKAEVDPLHERLDAQREQITTVEKNLTGQINTVRLEIKESEKNILEQIKPLANLLVNHDEQIAELQKAVGLRSKH